MKRRTRLRTRVLLLTAAFSVALFAIAFGMSWRERVAQEQWTRLIGVEQEAIGDLEELLRAQNAFHQRFTGGAQTADRYHIVTQLLQRPALASLDTSVIRSRVKAYAATIADPTATAQELDAASLNVVNATRRLIDERKREVARALPELQRNAWDTMSAGLAITWIVVISSFAAVQITLRKVVRPLEELSAAADRIAAGDLSARAPVAGDLEIAKLGGAFNRMADELKARARTDELTSLPNFRAFRERIDGEIERAGRYPARFGVLVLDLDKFKSYNDTYGHLAGNDALRRVAGAIRDTVRAVDFPARYGGEEFCVIVPQVDAAALQVTAERIRANIEALPAPADGAQVTVSIGAAVFPDDGTNVDALFVVADERLYAAKKGGRNRVVGGAATATAAVLPAGRSAGRSSA